MDLTEALRVFNLMKRRDYLLEMRSQAIQRENQDWSLLLNDRKLPISKEDKKFFREAIGKALDQVEAEIREM